MAGKLNAFAQVHVDCGSSGI